MGNESIENAMTAHEPRRASPLSRRAVLLGGVALAGAALATGAVPDRLTPGGMGLGAARTAAGSAAIDTLDFFVKRHVGSLTGSHLLVQLVDAERRRSFYLKGDAKRYEVHTWDETAISLVLDHDPERAYGLTPGIWLGRRMAVGDEVVVSGASRITWYDGACGVQRSAPYSYTIKVEQHLPAFDAGGDLGRQEVIVVRYLPPGGRAERFYYSRGWGWIGWEEYDDGSLLNRSWFNQVVGTTLQPSVREACLPLPRGA